MFIKTIDGEVKQFYFTTKLSNNIEVLENGFLRCNNVIMGRTGTQQYTTRELNIQTSDGKVHVININRYEEDVFHPETLKSMEGKTVTIGHPKDEKGQIQFVSADNVDDLEVGYILNVRRDGNNVVGDIIINNQEAIDMIINKDIKELSLGYDTKYELDGEEALKQTQIVINHLALVERGRAGNARIVDEKNQNIEEQGVKTLEKESFITKVLKGLGIKKATLDDDTEVSVEEEEKVEDEEEPKKEHLKEDKEKEEGSTKAEDDFKNERVSVSVETLETEYETETTVTETKQTTIHKDKDEEVEEENKEKEEVRNVMTLDEALKKIADLSPLKGTEAYEMAIKTIDEEMVNAGLGSIIKKETKVEIFGSIEPKNQTVTDSKEIKFKANDFLNGIQAVYNQFTPKELDKFNLATVDRRMKIKELSSVDARDLY